MNLPMSYIPDAVFPGDRFDIPMLDLNMQAEYVEAPVKMWASRRGVRSVREHLDFM